MARTALRSKIARLGVIALVIALAPSEPLGAPAPRSDSVRVAEDLEVLEVEVGAIEVDAAQGTVTFVPRDRVEMKPGQGYGWRMRVRTRRSKITWQEELLLPSAPKTWGISSHVRLSSDRRRAVTTMTAEPDREGYVSNAWFFAEGDPRGVYRVELEIDGVTVSSDDLIVY